MFTKTRNVARKYGAKIAAASVPALLFAQSAHATGDPITTMLASVDLTTVAASVAAICLLVIGIKLTFKGPDVAGRVIRKV